MAGGTGTGTGTGTGSASTSPVYVTDNDTAYKIGIRKATADIYGSGSGTPAAGTPTIEVERYAQNAHFNGIRPRTITFRRKDGDIYKYKRVVVCKKSDWDGASIGSTKTINSVQWTVHLKWNELIK